MFVNSTAFAEDVVAVKKDSSGAETVKETISNSEKSSTTVVVDTTIISLPYYRTLSIGYAFAFDLPDAESDDGTTTGNYLKLSMIFHEKDSTIYPSFVELDYIFGFGESNDVFMINYMFGKSFVGYYNTGLRIIVDVGLGMTHFWGRHSGQPENDKVGISGISRLGLGYNGFAFNIEHNIILTRDYSLEIIAINLSYTL